MTSKIDKLWFTRCPVPTASGLAYKLGWLDEEFARHGITLGTLQDRDPGAATDDERRALARHHYDHDLPGLFREGGNMLAFAARAQGAPNKVIGLTWIEEGQRIIVRKDSGITTPADLKGKRLALPAFIQRPIADHVRGSSIGRGMTLAGFKGALSIAGLTFDDVEFVETAVATASPGLANPVGAAGNGLGSLWSGLQQVADGTVDAAYVKGSAALDSALQLGLVVGIELDNFEDKRVRVNNGTPRPITVHQDLIENNFELVVGFLYQSLRAAEWAKGNLDGVLDVLKGETRGSDAGVRDTYRNGFHNHLHPDLSPERVALYRLQKKFLLLHGFLDADFDLDSWIDRRPLDEAYRRLQEDARRAA
ncbi:MAG: ABC transporter substrate-binding protein [Pseudomonadota bacterium]